MTQHRYQIRILDGERISCSGREYDFSLREIIASTDDAAEAQTIAASEGSRYPYGTAIVDTTTGTVDCGRDENGDPWTAALSDTLVR